MEVSSLAFYHGNISRDVAATNLTDKPPGSFLVRLSQPGFFAISYVAGLPAVFALFRYCVLCVYLCV